MNLHLDVDVAVKATGVARSTLYRWIRRGDLAMVEGRIWTEDVYRLRDARRARRLANLDRRFRMRHDL